MDFPKFQDLFANEELYLRRVDLFKENDPWEALPSDRMFTHQSKARAPERYDSADRTEPYRRSRASLRQNSEGYFVTCWQIFEAETLNMWERYGKGVCVFSRLDLMEAQLDPMLDPITVGLVRYQESSADPYNTIQFLFTKRGHFDRERELRIMLQCYESHGESQSPSRCE